MELNHYIFQGATISQCTKYRYNLWRQWPNTSAPKWAKIKGTQERGPKSCLFIMLNPSTANANADDPTIRRCVGFARRFDFERLEVVNLFAYRATEPAEVLDISDVDLAVGPENQDNVMRAVAHAGLIIAGWGVHGDHLGQDQEMLRWLKGKKVYALGLTQDGHPRHPLYLKGDAQLQLLP